MSINKAKEWIVRAQERIHPFSKPPVDRDAWKFLNEALIELEDAEKVEEELRDTRDLAIFTTRLWRAIAEIQKGKVNE